MSASKDSRYSKVVDYLQEQISRGVLKPGDKAPTQRQLAETLGFSVPTITRGFTEAQRIGLITSEVGRGTFVRGPKPTDYDHGPAAHPADMTVNGPAMGHIGTLLHSGLASVIENAPAANLLSYPHRSAEEQLGDSVADWLSDQGIPLDRHRAIFCAGAHNGLFVVLSALLKKGHRLFVDENTYPGIFAIAQHLGLELTPVRGDREGMLPDALEKLLSTGRDGAVFLNPTVQNPTGITIPLRRRKEIVAVTQRCGTTIVEDDVYRPLVEGAPPSFLELYPAGTVFVTSFSKALAPGLRLGVILAQPDAVPRLSEILTVDQYVLSPLATTIANAWLNSGLYKRIVESHRAEITRRQTLFSDFFSDASVSQGYHIWYQTESREAANNAVFQAAQQGIILPKPSAFQAGKTIASYGIRIALGAVDDRHRLAEVLNTLSKTISGQSTGRRVL